MFERGEKGFSPWPFDILYNLKLEMKDSKIYFFYFAACSKTQRHWWWWW